MSNLTVSKSIFHFTGVEGSMRGILKKDEEAFNILIKILKMQKFLMKPHKRQVRSEDGAGMSSDVFMACFTETPLEYIGSHLSAFGNFGVGISVDWAKAVGAVTYYILMKIITLRLLKLL